MTWIKKNIEYRKGTKWLNRSRVVYSDNFLLNDAPWLVRLVETWHYLRIIIIIWYWKSFAAAAASLSWLLWCKEKIYKEKNLSVPNNHVYKFSLFLYAIGKPMLSGYFNGIQEIMGK